MYDFFLQTILAVSIAVIIFILARGLPRVTLPSGEKSPDELSRLDKFIKYIPLQKADSAISGFFEKVLRKARVVNLKLENILSSWIARLRHTSNKPSGENAPDKNNIFGN